MGYFRIFYYVAYIFNTITRIIKRHGKWLLWFICIAIFLVVCMYNPKSQAVYIGDYTYGDPNYAVNDYYRKVNLDFLKRINNYNGDLKTEFLNRIKSNLYSFYIYYGSYDGTSVLNGVTYNTLNLRICIYRNNFQSANTINPSLYSNYCGVSDVDIKDLGLTNYYLYNFDGSGNLTFIRGGTNMTSMSLQMPSTLINFMDDYSYSYFFNNYSLEEIELLYDMNNKLNQANQELQTQTDYLTEDPSSDDFSTSDLPTDSGVTDTTTSGVDNIFTTVYNVFTGDVEVSKRNLNITIPFTR